MISFLARHPWLLMSIIVFPAAILATYPIPVLVVGGFGLAAWGATTWHDKRHVTRARMRRRAEYEHELWLRGDPRGLYGQYPPYGGTTWTSTHPIGDGGKPRTPAPT